MNQITLNRPNAAQSRARQMSERFNARAADALSTPVKRGYGASEALAMETLEIAEAGHEIAYSADVARYEFEISCLSARLAYATGADLVNVREQLSEAERDLALSKWEMKNNYA